MPGSPEAARALERIHVMAYGPDRLDEATPATFAQASAAIGRHPVTWINVNGVSHADVLEGLEKDLGVHPLAIEDVQNTRQRPKVDEYEGYLYIVVRMVYFVGGDLVSEQMSVILGKNYLITIQERPGDAFEPVRQRLRTGRANIRGSGADYLAYAVTDALVDSFFPILEEIGDGLEQLEDDIVEDPSTKTRARLQEYRHQLIALRRIAWPQREALTLLEREEYALVGKRSRVFFRDVADHAIRILDLIEADREYAADARDLYLSGLSVRMNEIMKVLTIIGTIFLPLTFITGVYGMNFHPDSPYNMPELSWRYGYVGVIALMLAVVGVQLYYFRKKGWF